MALPRTISGVAFFIQNYNCGPFRDGNGNHYAVFRDSVDTSLLEVWKADNGDAAWAEVDGASRPDSADNINVVWAYQDGTRLKIATQNNSKDVEYHEFATSDDGTSPDSWITTNELVDGASNTLTGGACSIGVRSDGDKIAVWQGRREDIAGTFYDRIEYAIHQGTAWTDVAGNIDDGGAVNYTSVILVMGASDKAHIYYKDDTNDDVYHKSLSSANSLSAAEALNDTTANTAGSFILTPGVYYDASGTERITLGWEDNAAVAVYTSEIDNDGVPGAEEQASGVTVQGDAHFLAVDPNTDTVYLVYSDSSTNDLWLDSNVNSGGWGTDTEILDAVSATEISANIYQIDNGDTVLAYVYLDGATVKYNEYVLVVAGGGTILPQMMQNYYGVYG